MFFIANILIRNDFRENIFAENILQMSFSKMFHGKIIRKIFKTTIFIRMENTETYCFFFYQMNYKLFENLKKLFENGTI